MVKVYTKTGDKGETSLFGGKRVSKANLRVEAYGTIDELNSAIGVAMAEISNRKSPYVPPFILQDKQGKQISNIRKELIRIQHDLLNIGSILANPKVKNAEYLEDRVTELEKSIDFFTAQMPQLTQFILPGGGKSGALLHFARTICRRAERRIVALNRKETVPEYLLKYCNRLSDYLFTIARFVNHIEKKKETVWKAGR